MALSSVPNCSFFSSSKNDVQVLSSQALRMMSGNFLDNLFKLVDKVWIFQISLYMQKRNAIPTRTKTELLLVQITMKVKKEVYGIIWMLFPILTLVLGITIGVLVIVWLERDISAGIQQREYAGPLGILQALADGTKLLLKENLIPSTGDAHLFSIGLQFSTLKNKYYSFSINNYLIIIWVYILKISSLKPSMEVSKLE